MQVEGGEVFPRTPLTSTTAKCMGVCATRHKFETILRQQVLAKCPNIELTCGGTVKGLLLSDDRTVVTGEGTDPQPPRQERAACAVHTCLRCKQAEHMPEVSCAIHDSTHTGAAGLQCTCQQLCEKCMEFSQKIMPL